MKAIVKATDLRVIFGKKVMALDGVTLELKPGKITGLIGPSGAGKTTLLRVLVGRVTPSSGTVDIFDSPPGSPELRRKIAYMTQDISVYKDLTVQQNLLYFGRIYGDKDRKSLLATINGVLEKLELSEKTDTLVRNLSGGQKQRVSLAVALIGSHSLLILDEPTTGLDPVLRAKLWEVFKDLRDTGTTIIISSHAMDEAQKCDDIVLVRRGTVIAHDSPAAIMKQTNTKSIEAAFLHVVGGNG